MAPLLKTILLNPFFFLIDYNHNLVLYREGKNCMIDNRILQLPRLFDVAGAHLNLISFWHYQMLLYRSLIRPTNPFQITSQVSFTYDPMKCEQTKIEDQPPTLDNIKTEPQEPYQNNIDQSLKPTEDLTPGRGINRSKKMGFQQK